MKQIYTSYLNNNINWEQYEILRVRVCRWVHSGQRERYDLMLTELFPTEEQIKNFDNFKSIEEWANSYRSLVLDNLNPQKIYTKLPEKCVLMCHEKPEKDGTLVCHRRLIASWLEQNIDNLQVEEWNNNNNNQDKILLW